MSWNETSQPQLTLLAVTMNKQRSA